jgi:hypothetical protein
LNSFRLRAKRSSGSPPESSSRRFRTNSMRGANRLCRSSGVNWRFGIPPDLAVEGCVTLRGPAARDVSGDGTVELTFAHVPLRSKQPLGYAQVSPDLGSDRGDV